VTRQSTAHQPKLDGEGFIPNHTPQKADAKPQVKAGEPFNPESFLSKVGAGSKRADFRLNHVIFAQGDSADAIYYIHKGKVKISVVSTRGKEAVIAILGAGDFFGEGCLAGQVKRMSSATAMPSASLMRLEKRAAVRVLHDDPGFTQVFLQHLLSRSIRIEEDLVDQLFNSSEKRLARVLLLLANFGKEGKPETVIANISQQTLAEIVGTTRSRVSFFMNKFRKLGFIQYNGHLEVHSSLLNVVLHD
jgi:CRP/FNR family cyclic AMP-dependent transcriptional regulator